MHTHRIPQPETANSYAIACAAYLRGEINFAALCAAYDGKVALLTPRNPAPKQRKDSK